MDVRLASDTDRAALVDLAVAFALESPHALGETPDAEVLGLVIDRCLEDGAIFVADQEGTLCGLLALLLGPHPLTQIPTALEVAWYVLPEYRIGTVGRDLVRAGEAHARQSGCRQMQLGAPDDRVAVFLERQRFTLRERTYVKVFERTGAELRAGQGLTSAERRAQRRGLGGRGRGE